jgi:STE24 endopeptidase
MTPTLAAAALAALVAASPAPASAAEAAVAVQLAAPPPEASGASGRIDPAVMAHEMGHYVLNHVPKILLQFGLLIVAGSAAVAALFERLRAWFSAWGVRGVEDPAGLPLLLLLVGVYMFLATPVLNAMIRSQEIEADLYGLQATRQPDGFARVALERGEHRKLDPGPLEEAIFFDPPSGRARIFAAMRWKAEHPETWSHP